jgi:DNA-binding NtrC family response regulator
MTKEPPMSPPITILVVEDDLGVQAALAEVLSLEDHSLMIVATVREADEALEQLGSARISLVLADIHLTSHLQGYEGYHLYERWHRRYPQIPFLLISGSPVSRDLPAVRTGEVRFLAKPFTFGDLLQAVREETHRSAGLFDT